jgi:hypothetical protein
MLSHEARLGGRVCMLAHQLGFPLPIEVRSGLLDREKLWKECGAPGGPVRQPRPDDLLKLDCRRLPADPIAPGKYAEIGLRRIRQHGDEFQQVIVRVAEVNCSRRHPGQHHRLVSWETG